VSRSTLSRTSPPAPRGPWPPAAPRPMLSPSSSLLRAPGATSPRARRRVPGAPTDQASRASRGAARHVASHRARRLLPSRRKLCERLRSVSSHKNPVHRSYRLPKGAITGGRRDCAVLSARIAPRELADPIGVRVHAELGVRRPPASRISAQCPIGVRSSSSRLPLWPGRG